MPWNQCSPSPELIVPKEEEHGKEHEKERVRTKHRSVHKVRVQPGRPDTPLRKHENNSIKLLFLFPGPSFGPREEREKKDRPATLR